MTYANYRLQSKLLCRVTKFNICGLLRNCDIIQISFLKKNENENDETSICDKTLKT